VNREVITIAAIQQEVIRLRALTVHREWSNLASRQYTGLQRSKGERITAAGARQDWEIVECPVVYRSSHDGSLGINNGRSFTDSYSLGDLANFKIHIQCE